jgi:anti-sigma-K factor RskA
MTHDAYAEKVALHALGALRGAEAEDLEAHLETCEACARQLAELRDTAAELTYAASPITPPAALSGRILDAVRAEADSSAAGSDRSAAVPSRSGPSKRWRRYLLRGAVAAALAFLVVSQISLVNRLDEALGVIARGRELIVFLASPEVSTVVLAGTDSAPAARAILAYNHRSGRVVFMASELPPPPPGKAYQLWFVGDAISPGAVFSPTSLRETVLYDQWRPQGSRAPLFAVTLETAAGVDSPTGDFVLLSVGRRGPADDHS